MKVVILILITLIAQVLGNTAETCPPCFNCNLPNFSCQQFSTCNEFTGFCDCLPGFGGPDCSETLCGSLSRGQQNRPTRKEPQCDCDDGWEGINCNMCTTNASCNPLMPGDLTGTCYSGGVLVNKFYQGCDVTNKKIVDILEGKKPQVTFSCNRSAEACDFQFWIQESQSFYCSLEDCEFTHDTLEKSNYKCKNVKCECVPGKMLCGESGSIDISDFLTETIRGPGQFSCDLTKGNCLFSEPSMNDLIQSVFGDPYITLHCDSRECVHFTELPGFVPPGKKKMSVSHIALLISTAVIGVAIVVGGCISAIGKTPLFSSRPDSTTSLPDDDDTLLSHHTPSTLSFEKVSYTVEGKCVLDHAFGVAYPGQCFAIMGGSGAGKTTLLDILAGKNKSGSVSGSIYVNGQQLDQSSFQKIIGFVSQEDYLLPTLTVFETVLNSALLRLPREMDLNTKKAKVYEVLAELRILSIKDRIIGSDFERGISGGEKRRVAIACELVTSPSILFLDEPTSGLDAYNARNVVESLVRLSSDLNRTVVFTIHQPRSNIVSLFDKLLLLSNGHVIYSGEMIHCRDFFLNNGYVCPDGYNLADYLIDITADHPPTSTDIESSNLGPTDPETGSESLHQPSDDPTLEWRHFAVHRDEFNNTLPRKERKRKIETIFEQSLLAEQELAEIETCKSQAKPSQSRPLKKASFFTQVMVLSSRAFKNLYRNPRLLVAHYFLSALMGAFCSYLYYNVSNDISGFQNRLGLFFFLLTLFGFSTLTGLHSFAVERIVFINERSNNYYHPLSYFLSKIVCDVLPLRLFTPVVLMVIVYPLVGLNLEEFKFFRCIGILVLFNLATSLEVLIIGILIKEPGAATMVGVLTLLFSLLFAGLFINKDTIPSQIEWLQNLSVFHYAYEALIVNETNGLILRERKFGLDIQVPGAVILSTFGFNVGAMVQDMWALVVMSMVFLLAGYLGLYYYVVERR